MLALRDIKVELGVPVEYTDSDVILTRYAAQVTAMIRQRTGRGIFWHVDRITVTGPVIEISSIAHGLRVGDKFKLKGSTTSTSVDGEYTVTAVPDHHKVQAAWGGAAVTGGTTQQATLHPLMTVEVIATKARQLWMPQQILPYLEIDEVHDRIALTGTEWSLVDPSYYRQSRSPKDAKALFLERITGQWALWSSFTRGQFALHRPAAIGTAKVAVFAGTDVLPMDLQMAAHSLVCDMFERQGTGKDITGMSFEGQTQQKMQGQERAEHMLSSQRLIDNWAIKGF
jgi:hypothetical protein